MPCYGTYKGRTEAQWTTGWEKRGSTEGAEGSRVGRPILEGGEGLHDWGQKAPGGGDLPLPPKV